MKHEIDETLRRVASGGHYIGGDEVEKLEEELARYCGSEYGVGLSSGTDALLASLMAVGVEEGDEVITSPFTFISTAEVVSLLRARPVFVDIERDTFNLDPNLVESSITERTKCIMPVHLFGHMADMGAIMDIAHRHGLKVIEDAAQAIGSSFNGKKAGSFGDTGCFSFFPSKNLGAFGDGGFVITDDPELSERIGILKEHGSAQRYHHSLLGFNGRLDTIQAAVLRVKLRYLDDWTEKRRKNASYYNDRLEKYVKVPICREGYFHVFNQYSILTEQRDRLTGHLSSRGVSTAIYYPIPLHLQEVFLGLDYDKGDFPVAEEVSERILSLPVFPELEENEKEYIVNSIVTFFER
jgi:UDP-2-acetamido-2-deoxy-ribo-hexuluronate aminotransferase